MPTIVLADDHHVVRQGLRALLEAEPDFNVIGEAADGLKAIQTCESLKPDVLVVDLMMGGVNGLEVTRQVRKCSPKTGIVMLSMYNLDAYVLDALRSGAKSYVLKESTADELVRAIHEVDIGHQYLSWSLFERAIEVYKQKHDVTGP